MCKMYLKLFVSGVRVRTLVILYSIFNISKKDITIHIQWELLWILLPFNTKSKTLSAIFPLSL